jgi:hypothetical protein
MNRYLIISPHTVEECTKTIQHIEAAGYITHFDWGCKDGEHCGWAIIEAENPKEALLVVPAFDRPKARAVMLTKFGPKDIPTVHR